jgi:DNA-binding MarR family transcriptional regulator
MPFMDQIPIDLQVYFPFFLGTISNRWTATSSRIYLANFGIGIGDWRVLASIQSLGKASSIEIVDLISMDPAAVSRSVAKLLAAAMVRPVEGKFKGRTKPFELTGEGRKLYAKVRRAALAQENTLLGGLSATERRTLLELMRKVHSRLDRL